MGGITTEPKIFTTFAAVMKGFILHSSIFIKQLYGRAGKPTVYC